MYEAIKALAERNRMAATEEEKQAVGREMEALQMQNPEAYGEALERLIGETSARVEALTVKEKLGEAARLLPLSYIAREYFGKTRSWLSHKMNGNVINGKPCTFSEEELATLRFALQDISRKIGSLSI